MLSNASIDVAFHDTGILNSDKIEYEVIIQFIYYLLLSLIAIIICYYINTSEAGNVSNSPQLAGDLLKNNNNVEEKKFKTYSLNIDKMNSNKDLYKHIDKIYPNGVGPNNKIKI